MSIEDFDAVRAALEGAEVVVSERTTFHDARDLRTGAVRRRGRVCGAQ
ncbi:MAG: hypothetical protein ACE5PT_02580 [Gemmatimonadales bacterium]